MENTFEYNKSLTDSEKLTALKSAKFGTWYDGWCPYHIIMKPQSETGCSSPRMIKMDYGFICPDCGAGSEIGFNLLPITDRN